MTETFAERGARIESAIKAASIGNGPKTCVIHPHDLTALAQWLDARIVYCDHMPQRDPEERGILLTHNGGHIHVAQDRVVAELA